MEVEAYYDTDLTETQWQIIKKQFPPQKQDTKQVCRQNHCPRARTY